MSLISEGSDGTSVLFDDILIYGTTQSEHDLRLNNVMSRDSVSTIAHFGPICEMLPTFGGIVLEVRIY